MRIDGIGALRMQQTINLARPGGMITAAEETPGRMDNASCTDIGVQKAEFQTACAQACGGCVQIALGAADLRVAIFRDGQDVQTRPPSRIILSCSRAAPAAQE